MARFGWRALMLVALAAWGCAAQDQAACDASTKVKYEPELQLASLAPKFIALSSVEVPTVCGDFNPVALANCQMDIPYREGCCEADCVGVVDPLATECLDSLLAVICEMQADIVEVVGTLARRCKSGYEFAGCSGGETPEAPDSAAQDPAGSEGASAPGPSPEAVDGDLEVLEDLEDGEDNVAKTGELLEEALELAPGGVDRVALCWSLAGIAALLGVVVV